MTTFQPNKRRCIECVRLHEGRGDVCERCCKAQRKEAQRHHDEAVRRLR